MALSPGSQLGRFRVVRQLGAGAMGEVYLSEDPDIERPVAIKTVRLENQSLEGSEGMQLRARLQREAKAAGRLVHPHIVTLFEAGESEGIYYLVFEYVEGTDLATRMRRLPPLEVAEIVRIGRETAAALDAAHRVGIIHRDIKPANLLLTTAGTVKVGDFGIAALTGQGSQLTMTGALIGTPQYLSPEQVRSEFPLDGRSDLFSLGVVLYELLGGKRPFAGGSVAALLYEVVAAEPTHLSELMPGLSPRLTSTVMRLLAKDPGDRFASAGELHEELVEIEKELASTPSAAPEIEDSELAPTLQLERSQEPTLRIDGAAPTVHVDTPAGRARGKRKSIALAVVATLILLGGATAAIVQFAFPGEEGASILSDAPVEPVAGRGTVPPIGVAKNEEPPVGDIQEQPAETVADAREELVSESPVARIVSGVVTFRIRPADAATDAVVKVDGLVRGLASGSAMTLRAGHHEIVITSPGFLPETLMVESRPASPGTTELEVLMTRIE